MGILIPFCHNICMLGINVKCIFKDFDSVSHFRYHKSLCSADQLHITGNKKNQVKVLSRKRRHGFYLDMHVVKMHACTLVYFLFFSQCENTSHAHQLLGPFICASPILKGEAKVDALTWCFSCRTPENDCKLYLFF